MKKLGGTVGIVLLPVITALIVTWSLGFLNQLVPSPEQTLLAVENLAWAKTECVDDRFCFVLCWLEHDHNGDNTSFVAHAFTNVQGVTLVRSAQIVKAAGAADDWRPAMQRDARAMLADWQADLAIVGLVKKSGKVLSLWFVPLQASARSHAVIGLTHWTRQLLEQIFTKISAPNSRPWL